ncbi:amidohydrolase family protein [Candidatus Pyrohabitans sp.]
MIIDSHAHFTPEGKLSRLEREAAGEYLLATGLKVTRYGSVEDLLKEMGKHGITRAVLMPVAASTSLREAERLNNLVAKAARGNSALIPFASVNPRCEGAVEELDRAVAELGLRGVKLNANLQDFTFGDDEVWTLFEAVEHLRIPVFIHSGFTVGMEKNNFSPEEVNELISSFPRVTFIFAHMGRHRSREDLPSVMPEPNVYLETSHAPGEVILRAIEISGADRIIFGSDFRYNFYPGYEIEKLTALPLNEEERHRIFYANAARLFGIGKKGFLPSLLRRR